ncbi:MAG: MBL fold metallo-hydrolase, partial [Pseudomonadota bacterium]
MATGTLILGDLLFVGHTPALDGSAKGWHKVLSDLTQLPAKHVVPGHGPVAMEWPDAATPLLSYLDTLIQDTRAELDQGTPMINAVEKIAESQRKRWLLFDQFNKRNATVVFQELEWE